MASLVVLSSFTLDRRPTDLLPFLPLSRAGACLLVIVITCRRTERSLTIWSPSRKDNAFYRMFVRQRRFSDLGSQWLMLALLAQPSTFALPDLLHEGYRDNRPRPASSKRVLANIRRRRCKHAVPHCYLHGPVVARWRPTSIVPSR